MTKRIISLLLAAVMLVGCFGIIATAAEDDGYSIVFDYDVINGYGDAKIYIKGGEYSVGRYGLKYNTSLLKLVKVSGAAVADFAATDAFSDIVKGYSDGSTYSVATTAETNTTEEMISTANGKIFFAWYKNDSDTSTPAIDASQDAKQIATISFALTDGTTPDDIKAATDLFQPVNAANLPDGWGNPYDVAKYNGAQGSEIVDLTPAEAYEGVNSISIDISDVTGVTCRTGRTVISVTLPGSLNSDVGIYSQIEKYEVSINYNGKVASAIVDKSAIDAQDGLTLPDFNSTNGIESGMIYTVYVTPITTEGKYGASSITGNVATEGIGNIPGGSTPPTGGGGGGGGAPAPAQYTVQFDAGKGAFPENEKHTFSIAPNALITEFPEVIEPVGMKFIGWSLDGENVVDLANYKVKANTSLVALYDIDGVHETFISGYPDGTVGPEKGLTRAEAAAIIARASDDFDESKKYSSNFVDVSSDEWYANYISFVYEKGIVTGYDDNTFLPSNLITRAEFATIMQRYGSLELNESVIFSDVDDTHWAKAYVGACKDAGLINGYEDGSFRPSNNITRAEAVTILNRLSGRTANTKAIDNYIKDNGIPFSDLEKGTWYFYEVMEAAFRHMIYYFHN